MAGVLIERRTLDEDELADVLGGPGMEDVEMTTTESRTEPTAERQALARTLVEELHSQGVVPHVSAGFVYLGMNASSRLAPSQIERARRLASELVGMLPTKPARPITSAFRC